MVKHSVLKLDPKKVIELDSTKACQMTPLKAAKILLKMELMMEIKKATWKVQKTALYFRSKRVEQKVYLTVNQKV